MKIILICFFVFFFLFCHYRFTAAEPGVVYCRQFADTAETQHVLLKPGARPPRILPPSLPAPGLSAERQQYLYDKIADQMPEILPVRHPKTFGMCFMLIFVFGMASCGLWLEDNYLIITTVKDGADGTGGVSIIKERGDRILPDKAFRSALAVIRCKVDIDGQRHTVYEPQDPNSTLITRPLVEAVGDENNHASLLLMLDLMEEVMRGKELSTNVNNWWRRHNLVFYNSMIDEKFDRAESGLQASSSKYTTRQTARKNIGSFDIFRIVETIEEMANYAQVNPKQETSSRTSRNR